MRIQKKAIQQYWAQNVPWLDTFNHYSELPISQRYTLTDQKRAEIEPYEEEAVKSLVQSGETVVEVGCGFGSDLRSFARHSMNAIGLDLSFQNAKLTRAGLNALDLSGEALVADAEHLPFRSGAIDVAYSSGVLHHTPNIEVAIDEIYRILKDGGKALVMVYHRGFAWYWIMLRYGILGLESVHHNTDELVSRRYDQTTLSRIYSKRQARMLFRKFSPVRFEVRQFGGVKSHPTYRYILVLFRMFPQLERAFGSFIFIHAEKS